LVIGRALPPDAGISQSCPSRSNTIDRPSGDTSKLRVVPSLIRMSMVFSGAWAGVWDAGGDAHMEATSENGRMSRN